MRMRTDATCPCCNIKGTKDTIQHTWECVAATRQVQFDKGVADLCLWLTKNKTEPTLQQFLLKYIEAKGKVSFAELESIPQELEGIASKQDKIGWTAILMGRFTKLIRAHQQQYFRDISKTCSIDTWCGRLAKQLTLLTHQQWILCCNAVHDKVSKGFHKGEKRELKSRMQEQLGKGESGLDEDDRHLVEISEAELLAQSAQHQRLWLREIMVARGKEVERNVLPPTRWGDIQENKRTHEYMCAAMVDTAVENIRKRARK